MSEFEDMVQVAPNLIKLEMEKYSDVGEYCEYLVRRYSGTSLLHSLSELAQVIEPVDRTLGYDEDLPCANAFLAGSVLGMRIVREFAPVDVQIKMESILVANDTEDEDWFERMHQLAVSALHSAERGFQLVPDLEPLVEEWAEQAVPEVIHQPFFRRGFGMVMYMLHEAFQVYATEQLMNADRDGVNWDEAFEKYFGTDTPE